MIKIQSQIYLPFLRTCRPGGGGEWIKLDGGKWDRMERLISVSSYELQKPHPNPVHDQQFEKTPAGIDYSVAGVFCPLCHSKGSEETIWVCLS